IGKYGIGLYLGQTGTASAFGAAGSVVVILVWIYYSAQIFLFGAEWTRVCAERKGLPIVPKANAVLLSADAVLPQGMPTQEHATAAAGADRSPPAPAWPARQRPGQQPAH